MKKLIPLLLLCLLLAACRDGSVPTDTGTQPQQSTAASTVPTTKPPASTAAPTEPTDPPTNLINNARKITIGMTRDDVYDLLHIHGEILFSNIEVRKWELDNGKLLYIWFHQADTEILVGGFDLCDGIMSWPNESELPAPDPQISAAYADRIQVGMQQSDTFSQLENAGTTVCQNAQLVQYPLLNGGFALVWYAEIDGIQTVCKAEVQTGALA